VLGVVCFAGVADIGGWGWGASPGVGGGGGGGSACTTQFLE
jgi:hypothetical protein